MPNGHKQHIDYTKCVKIFSKTLGCSICIKECTLFKSNFQKIKKTYKNITSKRMFALSLFDDT